MTTAHGFDKWETYNREHLEKCRGKYVAVTFSAGKDSSACLYFLTRAQEKYGYDLGGFLYAFPRHRYTPEFRDTLLPFWKDLGVDILYRETEIEDTILENVENPCRPCQNLRKKDLPEIFSLAGRPPEEVVIVSGHSLWDLAGYALDRFAANELANGTDYSESYSRDRFLEISQRFYPFLSMKEGYSVYRPMLFLNVEEISSVCEENSLPVLGTPCRYSELRPKKVLGGYFRAFGYSFEYTQVLDFARKFLNIADLAEIQRMSQEEYLAHRF
jgi:tRNA(Ile)-lysidine synthase TilS/MesJ